MFSTGGSEPPTVPLQSLIFVYALQPERISGEQYGIHADVWSVGISFMEVCFNGLML